MSVGYCYELYPDEVPRSFRWDVRELSLHREGAGGFLAESSSNLAQCWFGNQQCVMGNDEISWSRKRESMERL